MPRRHAYQAVPDDLCRSRSHFTAQAWSRFGENAEHLGDARGRHVVSAPDLNLQVGVVLAEVTRFYYYPTEREASIAVQLTWGLEGMRRNNAPGTARWQIQTQDSAGGNIATSPTLDESLAPPMEPSEIEAATIPLAYGFPLYEAPMRLASTMISLDHNAVLPLTGRVLIVYARLNPAASLRALYLMGVDAWGYRGGL